MDYLPYIKLQSYCCFCYCIVCQLLMVLLHCSLNIPADAVGSMSKLENCSFNTNTFHHILKVCFLIYFDLLFMNIFLSLSHPFCVVCMFTHMIRFRRKCLVIVLLNSHVLQSRSHVRCCFSRTGQALTICITTLFSLHLRVNYDYITNFLIDTKLSV